MKFLLDTDTCSQLARGRHPAVAERVSQHARSDLAVSVITVGELRFGLASSSSASGLARRTEALLASIVCLNVDLAVTLQYATLRAHLRRLGLPIGPNDHWIAAQALTADLTLVTGNTREFQRVPGLRVENWLR